MTKAVIDVISERARQISEECYTSTHDDKLIDCELAAAAACYAIGSNGLNYRGVHIWPGRWLFKKAPYRRMLVKAGALIIAEIERIDRKQEEATIANKDGDYQLVPKQPTEKMWSGLARDLMMWLDLNEKPTGYSLRKFLKSLGKEIPVFIDEEKETQDGDHVISKGTRAVLIYKAFLHDAEEETK